jgi:hypothetical protein
MCTCVDAAISWIEDHQGLAAWLQATGSIIAIWAAYAVGSRQARTQIAIFEQDRQERRAQEEQRGRIHARAIAVAIYPEILELKPRLQRLRTFLTGLAPPGIAIFMGSSSQMEHFRVRDMPSIERNYGVMHLLDPELGATVLQLVSVIGQINRLMDAPTQTHPLFNPSAVAQTVDIAIGAVDRILVDIQPIHDAGAKGTTLGN